MPVLADLAGGYFQFLVEGPSFQHVGRQHIMDFDATTHSFTDSRAGGNAVGTTILNVFQAVAKFYRTDTNISLSGVWKRDNTSGDFNEILFESIAVTPGTIAGLSQRQNLANQTTFNFALTSNFNQKFVLLSTEELIIIPTSVIGDSASSDKYNHLVGTLSANFSGLCTRHNVAYPNFAKVTGTLNQRLRRHYKFN